MELSKKHSKGGNIIIYHILPNVSEDGYKNCYHWDIPIVKWRKSFSEIILALTVRFIGIYQGMSMSQKYHNPYTMLYNTLPKGAFKTGTTERGKEFACCTNIEEQLGLTL